ncbi:hypothetical protein KKC97_00020 [bacterium]|nr:hypothetical protein [bacterium]MBU1636035.1 hypothetical protein [bacterium]MBU1920242.1 hypothetical protein [bacterium]
MKYVIVLFSHVATFPDPLKLKRGEQVKLGEKDAEWPGWVWGETVFGKGCWVPESYLSIQDHQGQMIRDFDATELNAAVGTRLRIIEETDGWYWCETDQGLCGWIPVNKTKGIE